MVLTAAKIFCSTHVSDVGPKITAIREDGYGVEAGHVLEAYCREASNVAD